jgi:hypothetical protein
VAPFEGGEEEEVVWRVIFLWRSQPEVIRAAVASSLVPKEGEDLVAGRSGTLGQPDSPNSSAPKSTISRDPGADTSSSKWSPEVG